MSKIKCLHCDKSGDLQPGNTVLYLFTKQPWFSYLEYICLKCGQMSRPFLGPYWRGWIMECEQFEIGRVSEEWAPLDLAEECHKVFGIKLLIPQQLGPRHEKQLAFMRYLLERGVAENELEV